MDFLKAGIDIADLGGARPGERAPPPAKLSDNRGETDFGRRRFSIALTLLRLQIPRRASAGAESGGDEPEGRFNIPERWLSLSPQRLPRRNDFL
jgi:hypothetical protein